MTGAIQLLRRREATESKQREKVSEGDPVKSVASKDLGPVLDVWGCCARETFEASQLQRAPSKRSHDRDLELTLDQYCHDWPHAHSLQPHLHPASMLL